MKSFVGYILISWVGIGLVAGVLWFLGAELGGVGFTVGAAVAMFSPLLATVLVQRAAGERPLRGLGATPRFNRWLAVAVGLGVVATILSTVCTLALPGITYDGTGAGFVARLSGHLQPEQLAEVEAQFSSLPVPMWVMVIPQMVVFGATLNALFAFGEEIGWRGWLHRKLAPRGFWVVSGVTGVVWGLWHAPLILLGHNYPDHPISGAFLFIVVCLLLSPLHTLVRVRGGSVWHAAVLHGTFNAGAGLSLLVTAGGTDLLLGPAGLGGILGLVVLNILALPWTLRTSTETVVPAVL